VAPVPLGACFYCLIEARYRAIRGSERASRSPASGKANPIDAGRKPRVPLRYTVKVILHLLHIFGSSAHAGSYFSLEGAQSQDIEIAQIIPSWEATAIVRPKAWLKRLCESLRSIYPSVILWPRIPFHEG